MAAAHDLSRRLSSSSRHGSNRSWGSNSIIEMFNAPDVFQRTSGRHMEEEDEESELRWAAIERLPTYDRVRKGVLKQVMSNGEVVQNQIDVTRLGNRDKKLLIQSILQVVEQDNEKFLLRLRNRSDRVGIQIPKIEVRFENLEIEGEAQVGSRALPTLLNSALNAIEGVLGTIGLSPSKKRVTKILHNVSGVIKPSRITLLLGPPGSGKTTLLKALAGKLDDDLRVSGKVTFCGHEFSEFYPQRTCAYISQHDLHSGELTVRETLDFSGRCMGVGTRHDMLLELSRREKEAGIKPDPEIDAYMKATAVAGQESSLVTDYIIKLLGLDICSDIMVGDEMRRGISGGQKKRVTTDTRDTRALLMASASKSIVAELNKDLKLNGDNYEVWSMKIKYVLEDQDLLDFLGTVMDEPEAGTTAQHRRDQEAYVAWKKRNSTARIILLSAMDDDITKQFRKYENTKDLWITLKEKFGGVSLTKLRSLTIKFDTYKKRPDHSMKKHLREMENMISELSDAGHKLTEEQKVQAVIRSLPPNWEHMKMHLTHNEGIKTFDDAIRHLELEEDRLASIKINVEANYTGSYSVGKRSNNQGKKRKRFNGKGKEQANEPNNLEQKGNKRPMNRKKPNISRVKCFNCQIKGHYAKDCTAPKVQRTM